MTANLSHAFVAIAHKRLVQVDLPNRGSNQHELNASVALREFFETSERVEGTIGWHYFEDDRERTHEDGKFTFYDARAKSADRTGRSEWRFYYSGDFLACAGEGDELILVRTKANDYHALVFKHDSAWLRSAMLLFGIESSGDSLDLISRDRIAERDLVLVKREILDTLELNIEVASEDSDKELVIREFGDRFPSTKEMSAFARRQLGMDLGNADVALLAWLDREEQLFRALEAVLIGDRIRKGFAEVDDFIKFSLSVQNRRKSRMGHALQNHLDEIFSLSGLRYTAQAKTEGGNKPDFIFPGEAEYRNPEFDTTLLLMLGVKSSAKDRWRQILPEAERIRDKHLCTLQPGISENQTSQMTKERVQLVVPTAVQATYSIAQQSAMLDLSSFIALAVSKRK